MMGGMYEIKIIITWQVVLKSVQKSLTWTVSHVYCPNVLLLTHFHNVLEEEGVPNRDGDSGTPLQGHKERRCLGT